MRVSEIRDYCSEALDFRCRCLDVLQQKIVMDGTMIQSVVMPS